MSEIYLELTIANIKHPERQHEVSFLVDTGATRAWVSKEIAEAVGIESVGTIPLELADSSITERPYGLCLFAYDGEIAAGNVVIGPPGCEPLVGTHVLQDFRLIVDLERHEVTRGRAMRAKRENPPYEFESQSLEQLYTFRRRVEVSRFLEKHPFLVPVLLEAYSKFGNYFGPYPRVSLEVVKDPEVQGLVELFGYIVTRLTPEEAGERLQGFDRDWFLNQLPRVKGLLNFDVEFL